MAAIDLFQTPGGRRVDRVDEQGITQPASLMEAVTNDAELTYVSRAIYVGVAGDISVVDMAGNTRLFKNAAAGSVIPIRITKVNASGTTATNLIALA